ncbi:MAG: hypothetical protein CL915_09725 [Deltaproteobacteria bacterium]|nr:hypothetical protein [Deltaproteobacteria bacterium]
MCHKQINRTNFEESIELVILAKELGLRIGSAPDTFLAVARRHSKKSSIGDGKHSEICSGTTLYRHDHHFQTTRGCRKKLFGETTVRCCVIRGKTYPTRDLLAPE